jgi:hypothetical protein
MGGYLGIIVSPSLPGLTRQSSFLLKMMDARVEPGHDERKKSATKLLMRRKRIGKQAAAADNPLSGWARIREKAANRDLTTPATPADTACGKNHHG